MAVKRSQNWLNQQRVDVPHVRSMESAVRNDFDELIGSFFIGMNSSYVIRGFELNMIGAIGAAASALQMIVADSALFHGKSAVSGSFYQIPTGTTNQILNSTTNTSVQGSFTPNSLNYVGVEFLRAVDATTTAQVFLWNPTNKNEISKTVPLAETLGYRIVITSSIWASNVLPISIVETDSSNNVLSVEDRRPMLFRLGTGGVNTPNPFNAYAWNHHTEGRTENFWKSSSSTSPFRGGDKQLLHFKEWADAVMSSLLEVKGTTYWYSANTGGGSLSKIRGDLALLEMTGAGKLSHDGTTSGKINWSTDMFLKYIGSRLEYKIASNAASANLTLADNEVAYINITRGVNIIPNLIFTQTSPIVTSVGAVSWTSSVVAGDYIKVGTEDDTKYYKILTVDSVSQVTLIENFLEASTGSSGVQAKYAYGTYTVVAVPSTNRHVQKAIRRSVPFNEDVYWLFFRADDGGAVPKIYVRGGTELEKGEEKDIGDDTSDDILAFIGSTGETDHLPNYANEHFITDGNNLVVAIGKLDAELYAHEIDTIDAHDASAISFVPTGSIAATDAQAAIAEVSGDIDAHLIDTIDAHDASVISVVPTGNIGSTDVQSALVELQGDIDTNTLAIAQFGGAQTIASAGATTTLTSASTHFTRITGSAAHAFTLPSTATLAVGSFWGFLNKSTGDVTIKDSASATLLVLAPNEVGYFRVLSTGAQTWMQWSHLDLTKVTTTIANNQVAAADVTGFLIDGTRFRSFEAKYWAYRTTASNEVVEAGIITGAYKTTAGTWQISISSIAGDADMDFTITAAGQLQYTSSNLAGATYAGNIKWAITDLIRI